jgi:hypothetical protein
MGRSNSKSSSSLKIGISFAGCLVFLAGLDWLWSLRATWPRSTSDPVPHHILEAIAVIIVGLYLVSKAR